MDVAAARHNDGPPGSSPNTTAQKLRKQGGSSGSLVSAAVSRAADATHDGWASLLSQSHWSAVASGPLRRSRVRRRVPQ